jgi:hypothetical protein
MTNPDSGVEVSLQPEDLEDQSGLERKYEEQLRKQNRIRMENEEDFSDMVAEQNAKLNVRVFPFGILPHLFTNNKFMCLI